MPPPAGVQRRRLSSSPAVRAALLYGAPALVVVLVACLPLIGGGETLILRDVHQTHLMLEAGPARALRAGELPVLDVHRGGGQPFTGNPNALPFYPLRLLYAVAPTLWALNAHFWLHWLLAPFGLYVLARAWGVGRPGAWAAGVCWATSGYFLSQLNLYNLVAGVALVPFLVAAALRATEAGARHRHRWAAAAGALWALVIVSGDPSTAVLGAALAGGAVAARSPASLVAWRTMAPLALAIALGTLLALPQVTELLRVLPATDRGYRGVADPRLAVGAWRPVHAVEWLVPTAFGRFDLQGEGGFWGRSLFAGDPPLLLSLYPGALATALVLASGLPRRRAALWAWAAVAVGALLATGGATPVGAFLFDLPGARLFRYPVKLWLLAAVGLSLLCGIGFERAFGSRGRPGRPGRVGWSLAGLALILAGLLALLVSRPDLLEHATFALGPESWTLQLAVAEHARWIATLVTVLALIAALGLCLYLARAKRRPALALALLLALHAAGQVHLLRGLLATDGTARLTRPSPLSAHLPEGSRVAHAGYLRLFGDTPEPSGPDPRPVWPIRQHFDALTPGAGILEAGLRYEVNRTPEGLSSFLLRVAGEAVRATPDDGVRLLALSRWGVEHVISERRLAGVPPGLAEETTVAGTLRPIHLYTLRRPAPEVVLADLPVRVPHLPAAWRLFTSPGFDPERHVVLPPAEGLAAEDRTPPLPEASGSRPGRHRVVRRGDEVLEVETASPVPAVLVFQRAAQPVWRATVDGEPVAIEPANLYRIGVPVPAGRHRVLLRVDRGPLRLALAASIAGLLGLVALAVVPGALRRRREAVEVEGAAEDV